MAEGLEPFYVLQNFGTRRNCTLTASFPAVVSIEGIEVGGTKGNVNYDVSLFVFVAKASSKFCFSLVKCDLPNNQDKVTVGGTNGLDSHHLTKASAVCGKSELKGPEQAIFCGVTSIRLESSGKYNNKVVVALRPADENDINLATAVCDL
jgi:hypothetical protein